MRIRLSLHRTISVETVSGAVLGRLHHIVLDTESHAVVSYEAGHLIGDTYLVSPMQAVRFEEKKLIVKDGIEPESHPSLLRKKNPSAPEPVAMRSEENA